MDYVTIGLARLDKTARDLYELIVNEHGYCDMPAFKAHPDYIMTEGDQFTIDVTAPQAEYIVEQMSMDIIDNG